MARARAETPTAPPGGKLRRLVPRHRFTAAQDALRRAKVAWTADAVHEHHAVVIATCARGAAVLERFDARPANGVTTSATKGAKLAARAGAKAWRAAKGPDPIGDPLERAFAEYRRKVRTGEAPGL